MTYHEANGHVFKSNNLLYYFHYYKNSKYSTGMHRFRKTEFCMTLDLTVVAQRKADFWLFFLLEGIPYF